MRGLLFSFLPANKVQNYPLQKLSAQYRFTRTYHSGKHRRLFHKLIDKYLENGLFRAGGQIVRLRPENPTQLSSKRFPALIAFVSDKEKGPLSGAFAF